jgi:hypothetical protein
MVLAAVDQVKRDARRLCIIVAPVRRKSCGVQALFFRPTSASASSLRRFFSGAGGGLSLFFLNIDLRSPTCLLICFPSILP